MDGPGSSDLAPGLVLGSDVEIGGDVAFGADVVVHSGTVIGEGVEIGPGCRLVDCTVGEHTTLEHTVARLSDIGADCAVGPYAALEPGSQVPAGTRTGPFYTAGAVAVLDD